MTPCHFSQDSSALPGQLPQLAIEKAAQAQQIAHLVVAVLQHRLQQQGKE